MMQPKKLVIQTIGDIAPTNELTCARNFAALVESLETINQSLGTCDLRIANWEAPLVGKSNATLSKFPRLCTTVQGAEAIMPLKLDVALLANNHIYDNLQEGFETTLDFLNSRGVACVGAGLTPMAAEEPLLLVRNGARLSILNYVAPYTNPGLPENADVHLNLLDPDRAASETRNMAAQADIVIVCLHWGIELYRYPTPAQRHLARRLVDCGAQLVVGHHPHCMQGSESWHNGHICYSLGNFIFGRNEINDRPWPLSCRRSAIASHTVHEGSVRSVTLYPTIQKGLVISLDEGALRNWKHRLLSVPLRFSPQLYNIFYCLYKLTQQVFVRPVRFIYDNKGPRRACHKLLLRSQLWLSSRLTRNSQKNSC